jgi:hypothetical protein
MDCWNASGGLDSPLTMKDVNTPPSSCSSATLAKALSTMLMRGSSVRCPVNRSLARGRVKEPMIVGGPWSKGNGCVAVTVDVLLALLRESDITTLSLSLLLVSDKMSGWKIQSFAERLSRRECAFDERSDLIWSFIRTFFWDVSPAHEL